MDQKTLVLGSSYEKNNSEIIRINYVGTVGELTEFTVFAGLFDCLFISLFYTFSKCLTLNLDIHIPAKNAASLCFSNKYTLTTFGVDPREDMFGPYQKKTPCGSYAPHRWPPARASSPPARASSHVSVLKKAATLVVDRVFVGDEISYPVI